MLRSDAATALDERRTRAVEEGLRNRSAAGARPSSCRPASLRTLPPPFHGYFSMTSDCDAPHLKRWLHVGETVRERFGLPITDSLFVSWPIRRGERNRHESGGFSKEPTEFDRERFVERSGPLIRRFHRGWFDVIHGWSQRLTIRIADDVVLRASPSAATSFAAKVRRRLTGASRPRDRAVLRFVAPASWQQHEPPRYLCLRYALPVSGTSFRLAGRVGAETVFDVSSLDLFDPHNRFVPLPAIVDLQPLMGNAPKDLLALEIEVQLVGEQPGATVVIEAPTLVSNIRSGVKAQLDVLARHNMLMSTFSTHGIGMVFAARHVADIASTDRRWLADDPTNPVYFKDLLDLAGVEFYNTFNNIAQDEVLPLASLLRPVVFNDGSVSYDFHRYINIPRDAAGLPDMSHFTHEGTPTNPSASDYLGFHIRAALAGMTEPGSGALIYTHAGVRCNVLMGAETRRDGAAPDRFDAIDADGQAALGEVADRLYDLSGDVPNDRRTWVAPTSSVVRLAQAMRGIGEHSWYDPATNAVFIETWFDPVTKSPVPAPSRGVSDLRWLTFYVDDAATATVQVDGRPITHLIRNAPDETGRPSVTIADARAPTVIIDEVDPRVRGRVETEDAVAEITEAFAFRGNRSLRLETRGETGCVVFTPHVPIDARGCQSVRVAILRADDDAAVALRLRMAGGGTWSIADVDLAETGASILAPAAAGAWSDTVVPFWSLTSAAAAAGQRVPPERIESVELRVRGTVAIDCLELLRDWDGPAPEDDCCLVGGRIDPPRAIEHVILTVDDETHRTAPTKTGYYLFEHRVPRGAIVRIHAETRSGETIEPARGGRHEIVRDDMDFDVVVAPQR